MEKERDEQPEAKASGKAVAEGAEDSLAGAEESQPAGKRWANLFETPEKLEEAYRRLYRAYHERSREMKELREIAGAAESAGAAEAGSPAETQDGEMIVNALMEMVAEARQEAQRAKESGERLLVASLEGQIRGFYEGHPDLETMGGGLDGFREEVLGMLGGDGAESLGRLPGALEKAYRVATYPAAKRDAEKRTAESEESSRRFAVEGGSAGSMTMPQNRSRERDFRSLVERLKREAGLVG